MRKDFLIFGSPLIGNDEINEVTDSLVSGWLGTGPKVHRFENDFANYKGVKNAVAVNSCTAALHLSLLTADFNHGDEVITTPMTFCATVNSIIHAGATPVLADINPSTFNIDPSSVEAAITPNTKAIIAVHFAGHPCDMDALSSIASKHNLLLIEDCAHAIETLYKGKPAGTIGDFGCFSFYVTKNISTGEGGMILARNSDRLERIKTLALHGMSLDAWNRFGSKGYKHYDVVECGFKYNMMDLQASIGIHQLSRVAQMWERRASIWHRYLSELKDLPIILPSSNLDPNSKHGYHLFTILVDSDESGITRDDFLGEMSKYKIGVGVHYRSIPEFPYYKNRYNWNPHNWPNGFKVGRQTVSLPLSPKMTNSDVDDVIDTVKLIFNM